MRLFGLALAALAAAGALAPTRRAAVVLWPSVVVFTSEVRDDDRIER